MKKIVVVALIMSILAMGLAGCSTKTSVKNDVPLQKVTVMLDWFPNTNHSGLYVAKDQGYYAEEGLDVNIIQAAEGGNPQLIAAGKTDFAISYQEEVTIARSQDIPVVAIAAVIQHNTSGFASPVSKNIKTPKDFEGKTYGGWGSPAETAVLKVLMDKYGADINKVKMVNVGSADFFASMEKGIDFSWIFEGWTGIEAKTKGIDLNFIKPKDVYNILDYYTPVIIAGENIISQDPELVKKFMKATTKGYNFAIDNPDKTAAILIKSVPELNKDLVIASQTYLSKEYKSDAPRWGEMKSEVWKDYAVFMFVYKLIDKNIQVEQAFTNKFLPE
ncbi:MAG: ABC transporter substrate-binding protein [Firmicutes bacterium HGW-Firmicutes-15]|nr:MAG: ABC transporter substrate-binding protein [Firmicutes bacterium HGW-Firmicutes-15]